MKRIFNRKSKDENKKAIKFIAIWADDNGNGTFGVLANLCKTKQAAILEAEADRESAIRRAAGEAEAIKQVADAKAQEIELVYKAMMKANPDEKVVQLKSLEALEKVADGEANKVFIPFEATNALSSLGAMKEIVKDDKKSK